MKGFTLIESQSALDAFHEENAQVEWMSFDTEFVGERRYQTSLCLVQVGTRYGAYLIDPLAVKDLGPILRMIQDPSILKITHAGENDYRLLYNLYGILPRNVYDTQVAAGFLGYKYPVAFKKLVDTELRLNLKKSHTVADWEIRPFKPSQLEYALEDILPLHPLWEVQQQKLRDNGRLSWAEEEFWELEQESFYAKDPNHEALSSQMIKSLHKKEQLFLVRLYAWRNRLAEKRNHSKEMVLAGKWIPYIVKGMRSGKEALMDNRRMPSKIVQDHWDTWYKMYVETASAEEQRILKSIHQDEEENPREEILIEMLYLVVRHHCLEHGVSSALAMPRNVLKRIQDDPRQAEALFGRGWRRALFGDQFDRWLQHYQRMGIHLYSDRIELRLDHE